MLLCIAAEARHFEVDDIVLAKTFDTTYIPTHIKCSHLIVLSKYILALHELYRLRLPVCWCCYALLCTYMYVHIYFNVCARACACVYTHLHAHTLAHKHIYIYHINGKSIMGLYEYRRLHVRVFMFGESMHSCVSILRINVCLHV